MPKFLIKTTEAITRVYGVDAVNEAAAKELARDGQAGVPLATGPGYVTYSEATQVETLDWRTREQARLDVGHYQPASFEGRPGHFLHQSTDDPAKVAYTKDDYRGEQDIQTRTTPEAYRERYL